jgi:hypothetical protein
MLISLLFFFSPFPDTCTGNGAFGAGTGTTISTIQNVYLRRYQEHHVKNKMDSCCCCLCGISGIVPVPNGWQCRNYKEIYKGA